MTKNKLKMWKKALCLIFAFLLSINSFAAVVSDNDGSAFITKSEFDSLKNDFQSQLDSYNSGIDSKIDNAISSYLAGISIEKTRKIEPLITNFQQIRWMHGPYMYFTNRHFTEYTTTAGRYVDTTAWQILNPENRRQTNNDGYLWFHDIIMDSSFSGHYVTIMLHPYNVPWAWGTGRGGITSSRGPTIYSPMKNETNGWAIYSADGGMKGENHWDRLYTRPHHFTNISPQSEAFGGVNTNTRLSHVYDNDAMSLAANTLNDQMLCNFTIQNIRYGNSAGSAGGSNGWIQSTIYKAENPGFIQSVHQNLWQTGDGAYGLKTACGYEGFMGDNYSRSGSTLVEDNRWYTERQFNGDMSNFIFSMWGDEVNGYMNVAPPAKTDGDFFYIDLSGSPNSVTIPFYTKSLSLGVQHPWGMGCDNLMAGLQASTKANAAGSMNLTFPLFYRVRWADMLSGEFKYKGKSICKSDGYPIVNNIEKDGKIKLKIKYEEKTDNDTSVVTLTPDQKIKTYFKNKPFSDMTGTFFSGYTNLEGTGTEVVLNGTEWNQDATTGAREITLNIPVKKGDSIWMRIDPLTSDGIYCAMSEISCDYITE